MKLDVWSDLACPWCWVGKKNLEAALATAGGVEVDITWRAFELNPRAPTVAPPSVDYVAKLAAKYRMSREQAQGFIDRMTGAGTAVGIDFRFDHIRPSNTFDAHRLLAWAKPRGLQGALKERLFRAYLTEGRALGDPANLCMLAADVGLDGGDADVVLSSKQFSDEVRADESRATSLGISGVPFFLIEGRVGLSGAQPPEVLAEAFAHVRDLIARDASPEGDGPGCSVDGC